MVVEPYIVLGTAKTIKVKFAISESMREEALNVQARRPDLLGLPSTEEARIECLRPRTPGSRLASNLAPPWDRETEPGGQRRPRTAAVGGRPQAGLEFVEKVLTAMILGGCSPRLV